MSEDYKVHLLPGYFRINSFQRRSPQRQRATTSRHACAFEKNEDFDSASNKNTLLKLAVKEKITSKIKKLSLKKKALRAALHEQDYKASEESRTVSAIKLKKVS